VSVRLVLDTTALLAYVAGDTRAFELGELMANVQDDGDITGLPALCLIAAYQQVTAEQRVMLLELAGDDDGPTVILPLLAADVALVAELTDGLPYDRAHAVSAAAQHTALLGTFQRSKYQGVDPEDILDL
jgi:hypothetical protein